MEAFIWSLLGHVVYPVFLLLGLLDYAAHQRTHIAATSGLRESWLHVTQVIQNGIPVLLVLFFEINSLNLVVIGALVVMHTLTAYVDIRYTYSRREIRPPEQLVHAFMIGVPILAWVLLLIIWRAAPPAVSEWSLLPRPQPFDVKVILAVLSSAAVFGAAPTLAELLQTWRAARREAAQNG